MSQFPPQGPPPKSGSGATVLGIVLCLVGVGIAVGSFLVTREDDEKSGEGESSEQADGGSGSEDGGGGEGEAAAGEGGGGGAADTPEAAGEGYVAAMTAGDCDLATTYVTENFLSEVGDPCQEIEGVPEGVELVGAEATIDGDTANVYVTSLLDGEEGVDEYGAILTDDGWKLDN